MKKKLLVGLMIGLSTLFVGCESEGDSIDNGQTNTRFVDTGDYYKIDGLRFDIVRDTETNNLYMYSSDTYHRAITPIYDKDGKIEKYHKK